jgi:hypothetical protein
LHWQSDCFAPKGRWPRSRKTPAGGGTSYKIVKLDDDEDGVWECQARDVNNLREVVGRADDPKTPEVRAAYWVVTGSGADIRSELRFLTGGRGASSINNVGEIVGYGKDSAGLEVGLDWADAGAAPKPLTLLNQNMHSGASATKNDGVICGHSGGEAGRPAPSAGAGARVS